MKKVIFLDIDGPLLPEKMKLFDQNYEKPYFDPFAVRAFNLWAEHSDAEVVFSTNWKLSHTVEELKQIMVINGLRLKYHKNPVTPTKLTSDRFGEIISWLADNEECIFLVIDDDITCKYIEPFFANLPESFKKKSHGKWIKVDYYNGLTLQNFEEGCNALGIDYVETY